MSTAIIPSHVPRHLVRDMDPYMEEWLKRIPNFSTRAGDPPVTANGAAMGVIRLPLVWVNRS